jgi:hypothetical protein
MAGNPSCEGEKKRLANALAKVSEQYQEIDFLKKQLKASRSGDLSATTASSGKGGAVAADLVKQLAEKGTVWNGHYKEAEARAETAEQRLKELGAVTVAVPPSHASKAFSNPGALLNSHMKGAASSGASTQTGHSKSKQASAVKENKDSVSMPSSRKLRSLGGSSQSQTEQQQRRRLKH